MMRRLMDMLTRRRLSGEEYARRVGVSVGNGCRIATYRFGSEPYLISIGDRTRVSRDVVFITHDGSVWHHRVQVPDLDVFGKITIGSDCYIGPNVYILPGVEIGDGCVIGANSVVTKSVPPGSVAAGNPIRYLGATQDYYAKMERFNAGTKGLDPGAKKERLLAMDSDRFLKKPMLNRPMLNREGTKQ